MKISSRLLARWIYQAVLYLYPPRFRREFGAQMGQDFALIYRSYRQRPRWHQRAAFWVLIGKDVIGSLWREYRALLPAPRGWWWLRLAGLIGVSVGVFRSAMFIELTTDAWLLPDRYTLEWWLFCMPLSTFAFALPLSFGLWTLPGWRLQPLVRALSVLLALVKLIPEVLHFIWLEKLRDANRPLEPLLGAWHPFVYGMLLPGISLATILILSCISLRKPSHRWWSIAMLMIYLAPTLTYQIADAIGYIPSGIAGNWAGYRDAIHILSMGHVLIALGWIFFGVKLWMSVPRRAEQGQVAATG